MLEIWGAALKSNISTDAANIKNHLAKMIHGPKRLGFELKRYIILYIKSRNHLMYQVMNHYYMWEERF